MPGIPELPGNLVPEHSVQDNWLKSHVGRLCQVDHNRFPGSQPVSFGQNDLDKLEREDYWVCEKSDGIRVLVLIAPDPNVPPENNSQMVYLIDRHNRYRELSGLFFPHHENPRIPLGNTILDGELVLDVDPRTQQETPRLLFFDCLVVDNQNVMSRPLDKRYGRLQEWFYKPYARMIRDHPHMLVGQPFDVKVKQMNLSYHVEKVFLEDIPALQHGNDGLIYTCAQSPYVVGTDQRILKWKPPSENSIDFKLVLRFPALPGRPSEPDFYSKPIFALHVWGGGTVYEPFDVMHVEDDEWEKMKSSDEQIDDRIVEVHWDPAGEHWRMMRFRDDKPNGNHRTTVDSILQSIRDGVEKEDLLARSTSIRNAWKARQQNASTVAPQAQSVPHSHPQPPPPPPPIAPVIRMSAPSLSQEMRYGPLAPSPWSKVGGPAMVAGLYR